MCCASEVAEGAETPGDFRAPAKLPCLFLGQMVNIPLRSRVRGRSPVASSVWLDMNHFTRWAICLMMAAALLGEAGCRLMQREAMATKLLAQSRLLSQQALYAMQKSDLQEADRLLVQALRTSPQDTEARARYARVLWMCGKREQALQQLQIALRMAPDNSDLHVQIAECYLELGQVNLAKNHAELAVRLGPKNPSAWLMMGRVALSQRETEKALAAFHRALGLRPGDREALPWIARAYEIKGDWEQVLAVRQRILEGYAPGEEPAEQLAALAEAYRALGRFADAATTYLQAAQKTSEPTEYLVAAAEAYLQAGQMEAAGELVNRVLAAKPQNPRALDLSSQLRGTLVAGHPTAWQR